MNVIDVFLAHFNVLVLCNYKNKLTLVPCSESESGYYPNYDKASFYESEHNFMFPKFVEYIGDEHFVDGIMFIKTNTGIQVHCVELGWDGFQIITDERGQ